MAFVPSTLFQVTVNYEDWQGHKFTTQHYIRPSITVGTIQQNLESAYNIAVGLVERIRAISDNAINSWTISLFSAEDTPETPVGMSEGEDKGFFGWVVEGLFHSSSAFAGIDKSKLQPNGVDIDTTDADVAELITYMTSLIDAGILPGLTDTGRMADYRNAAILSNDEAYLQQRASGKRGTRRRAG